MQHKKQIWHESQIFLMLQFRTSVATTNKYASQYKHMEGHVVGSKSERTNTMRRLRCPPIHATHIKYYKGFHKIHKAAHRRALLPGFTVAALSLHVTHHMRGKNTTSWSTRKSLCGDLTWRVWDKCQCSRCPEWQCRQQEFRSRRSNCAYDMWKA